MFGARSALVGSALVGVCYAPPAIADTEVRVGSDDSLPYGQWVTESKVPTPSVSIWVWRDDCPFNPGYNCTNGRTIWLHPLEHNLRETFFHELGHVVDLRMAVRADRDAFRAATGVEGRWRSTA